MIRQALQLQHSNVLFPGPTHMSQTCERGAYSISSDPDRLDLDTIHAYLVRAYWCEGIPRQTLERAITKSLCFGLFHGSDYSTEKIRSALVSQPAAPMAST